MINLSQKSYRSLIIVGILATFFTPVSPSIAQVSEDGTVQPLQGLRTQDNSNPFSGNTDYGGVFDLYHRLQLGTGGNLNEFTRQQGEIINDEATTFRERQRLLLQQRQQQMVPAPEATAE